MKPSATASSGTVGHIPDQSSFGGNKLSKNNSFGPNGEKETIGFLTVAAIRGVGQRELTRLADSGRSFRSILEDGADDLAGQSGLDKNVEILQSEWNVLVEEARSQALRLFDSLRAKGVSLVFRGDPHFPKSLMNLNRPPHWLFIQGSVAPLGKTAVAIVGTRKPSEDGLFLARYVGACLADWSAVTVSGLANGVDQIAHECSLRVGVPTIAVLGTGILGEYPKGSRALRGRILENGGTIISEYLPRASYNAENFVQRNRLQAAMGRVLIPVEWARRSGTAHTVRFATDLKRPIACLRLSDWSTDRVVLESDLGGEKGRLFTLPREHTNFDRFVREAIGEISPPKGRQLTLFGDE